MFPDFPFDPKLKSFLPHQEVQKYLEQYCLAHHIRPHIRVSPTGLARQLHETLLVSVTKIITLIFFLK